VRVFILTSLPASSPAQLSFLGLGIDLPRKTSDNHIRKRTENCQPKSVKDTLYIVSGDADLTTLGKHGKTRIITLAEFKDLYLK